MFLKVYLKNYRILYLEFEFYFEFLYEIYIFYLNQSYKSKQVVFQI